MPSGSSVRYSHRRRGSGRASDGPSGVLRRDHGRVVVDFSPDGRRSNTSYFAIHFAIIALSLAHIIWVRRFNLGLSFSFFSLFFFGVIPLFEYRLGVTYQGAATPED